MTEYNLNMRGKKNKTVRRSNSIASPALYDSLTKQPVKLRRATRDRPLKIYACGPTVYGPIHIGNARAFVTYRLLANYLNQIGQPTIHASNITDVNEKIDRAALDRNLSGQEWANTASEMYIQDTNRLGLGRPDFEPRVSDTLSEIIAMIEKLIDKGHAYKTPAGNVWYDSSQNKDLGMLSGRKVEDALEPSRALRGDDKKRPADFALWKSGDSFDNVKLYESPWGLGRPGWHIECSAMSEITLGEHFDIHGGGLDLTFPHHEAERAQSKSLGHKHADMWWHSGLITVDGEKGSKTAGNLPSLKAILDEYPSYALLLFYMRSHPRKPLEWSQKALEESVRFADRLIEHVRLSDQAAEANDPRLMKFHKAMEDDLNLPEAIAEVIDLAKNKEYPAMLKALELLSLGELIDKAKEETAIPKQVQDLFEQREKARVNKDWALSDKLRDQISTLGYQVRDSGSTSQIIKNN